MQRATISVSEGRFPEARFDNRRTMEPSIGYALTRLRAQARALGAGIDVEVDDRGTRLSLTIDAEGRLHALPGSPTAASDPMVARPDTSAPTQALPVTPFDSTGTARTNTPRAEASRDHRRTFTPDWGPAPALTPPRHRAQARHRPRARPGRTGVIAALIAAALVLCCAGPFLT